MLNGEYSHLGMVVRCLTTVPGSQLGQIDEFVAYDGEVVLSPAATFVPIRNR